ncbi:hypothetical protein MRX96_037651 [Rhipicephalus microplus]
MQIFQSHAQVHLHGKQCIPLATPEMIRECRTFINWLLDISDTCAVFLAWQVCANWPMIFLSHFRNKKTLNDVETQGFANKLMLLMLFVQYLQSSATKTPWCLKYNIGN